MKKFMILIAALLMTASAAFADYEAADGAGKTLGSTKTLVVKGSKGVSVNYAGDTTAGQGYVLGAYHASGTKTYGSSSGDTKIFFKDGTAVSMPGTVPTGSNSADFSAWTAL